MNKDKLNEGTVTTKQIRHIHAMLRNKGLLDVKTSLVRGYTSNRTLSVSKMTMKEADDLILFLQGQKQTKNSNPSFKQGDDQRKKIIAFCREMGMETWSEAKGCMVADMKAVYTFIKRNGYLKKGLNQYTYSELNKLVSQVQQIHKSYIERKVLE